MVFNDWLKEISFLPMFLKNKHPEVNVEYLLEEIKKRAQNATWTQQLVNEGCIDVTAHLDILMEIVHTDPIDFWAI